MHLTWGQRRPIIFFAFGTAAAAAFGLSLVTASPATARVTHTITSPNGQINLVVTDQTNGSLTFGVTAGTTTIFGSSPLGISTSSTDFSIGLSYQSEARAVITETYWLPAGTKPSYLNDGIAFRYRLPGTGPATITNETNGFRLNPADGGWAAP